MVLHKGEKGHDVHFQTTPALMARDGHMQLADHYVGCMVGLCHGVVYLGTAAPHVVVDEGAVVPTLRFPQKCKNQKITEPPPLVLPPPAHPQPLPCHLWC